LRLSVQIFLVEREFKPGGAGRDSPIVVVRMMTA
jgi:hypothetical protein